MGAYKKSIDLKNQGFRKRVLKKRYPSSIRPLSDIVIDNTFESINVSKENVNDGSPPSVFNNDLSITTLPPESPECID